MCTPSVSSLVQGQVSSENTVGHTVLELPWMLQAGASKLRTGLEARAFSNSPGLTVLRRYAAVRTEEPEDWVNGTTRDAEGEYVEDTTLSTTTDMMWIQVALKAASGTTDTVASAYAKLQASITGSGKLIATQVVEGTPTTNATAVTYIPVGQPIPAIGLTAFMAAIIVSGVTGTLAYGLGYRTFSTNMQQASEWTSLANYTGVTAPELKNTGELDMTSATAAMYVQLGLRYSGTTTAARFHVAAAAIY